MLKKCLSEFKKTVVIYISNGILQILAATLVIVYFQKLIDSIGVVKEIKGITTIILIYALLQLLDYSLGYVDSYLDSKLRNSIYYYIKTMVVEKISSIDYLSYKKYGTGKLIQLIENGASAGRNILFDFYLKLFRNLLPTVVFSVILIGIYEYKILIAVALSYGVVFLLTKILLKKLYAVKNKSLINEELLTSKIVRAFMEMTVFRIGKRYKKEIEYSRKVSKNIVDAKTHVLMTHEAFFTIFAIIVVIIKIIVILIGINQIISGDSTIGAIVAIVALIDRIYQPIAIFNVNYIDFKLNKVTYSRLQKFFEEKDDINMINGININNSFSTVKLENVSFKYNDTKIICNFSYKFISGNSYILTGSSGIGKTTLLNIIIGLIKPNEGEIFIGDNELSAINLNSFYSHVEYLSQQPPIFDGTIRENLVFDAEYSDEYLYGILEKVNLGAKVEEINLGLDSQVGEKGTLLSGGEKQRLAIAKILISKPKIVILDEPTSALDEKNEEKVLTVLLSELKDSIIIGVTHRLGTIQTFDYEVNLSNI